MTLVWKSGYSFDSDASTYIDAVETADGQALETGVRVAINDFVLGCKQDGIWNAIKASCILAGARTLDGALVPLVGGAPTNNNFVSGDYDRETGLVGDGSTKYLDSNRNNNADPQNSNHNAIYITSANSGGAVYMGCGVTGGETGVNNFGPVSGNLFLRNRSSTQSILSGLAGAIGLMGSSRSASSSYLFRAAGANNTATSASQAPYDGDVFVFGLGTSLRTNARLAFYSIGESLDLDLLDTRVSNLITAIGAAIP